jgi:CRP/FNR family transcriptional regulator, cyclic AMP receptor protein
VAADEELRQLPIFEGLAPEPARELQAEMTRRPVPRGHVVFAEGQPGNRLFAILDGKVKISQSGPDGRENLLAILGPGDLFGELSLFDPGPRTATATAVSDAHLASLDHDQLRPYLTQHPAVSIQLLEAVARRLRRTNEAMADLVFSDVPGRMAKTLLELADRFGEPAGPVDGHWPPGAVRVAHDLTQEELAQLVGASRETVNKTLSDFVARGWLIVDGRAVVILNRERLARRAP